MCNCLDFQFGSIISSALSHHQHIKCEFYQYAFNEYGVLENIIQFMEFT